MVDAVLAVEDSEFYAHDGVNLRSTLRALARNVDEGATVQGGSTITQQLVKVRSEEHTSELQSLMRISYAVFCLKKKNHNIPTPNLLTTLHSITTTNHITTN